MNKLLDNVFDKLVSKDLIVGYEEDANSGYVFLQLPIFNWVGLPVEMLVDMSAQNSINLVGEGYCSFSMNGPRRGTISYYAFVAANMINRDLTEKEGIGRWSFEMTADTIEDALQTNGRGTFIFCSTIPLLDDNAMVTCLKKGIDSFLLTRGRINRFLEKAAEHPDELDADDALLGNKQDVFFHPVLDEILAQYGVQDDESL